MLRPEKIVCVGQNYRAHSREMGGVEMAEPILFGKFAATLLAPGEAIEIPPEATHVDAEAELAVVIGKSVRRVSRERALDAVAGYVCANDVSARNLQYGDGQWFRGKNFATFCPVGPGEPVPVSELGDGSGLRVVQRLNGETLQDGTTSDLIFDVPYLVAFASNLFTLEPGDLILTGTPAGVGWAREPKVSLQPGDVVEVEVERIGVLSNPVVAFGT
jgi:2-keto-4-pentenoate hydratase/2-oxohepta-3-ene-1,7-dioic acid hydratase in catechol pathway